MSIPIIIYFILFEGICGLLLKIFGSNTNNIYIKEIIRGKILVSLSIFIIVITLIIILMGTISLIELNKLERIIWLFLK